MIYSFNILFQGVNKASCATCFFIYHSSIQTEMHNDQANKKKKTVKIKNTKNFSNI